MDDMLILVLIAMAIFALFVALVTGILLWRTAYGEHAKRTRARFESLGASDAKRIVRTKSKRVFSRIQWLDVALKDIAFVSWLDRQLLRAGLSVQVDQVLGVWISGFVLVVLILSLLDISIYFALALLSVLIVLPGWLLRRMMAKRRQLFEEQLPDVLDFISRSMQAGHAFSSALQVAAAESPQPTAGEFLKTLNEINFGIPIDQALRDLSERIDSPDMKFFAVAVMINREVGGDLAGLLDNLSSLIRARIGMRTSIRALTAEGRFSAWLLSAMPFFVALVIFMLRPGFLAPLWEEPIGLRLLGWALGLMLLGMLWMRRLANIHV